MCQKLIETSIEDCHDDGDDDIMIEYCRLYECIEKKITFVVWMRMLLTQLFHLLTVVELKFDMFSSSFVLFLFYFSYSWDSKQWTICVQQEGRKELKLNQSPFFVLLLSVIALRVCIDGWMDEWMIMSFSINLSLSKVVWTISIEVEDAY